MSKAKAATKSAMYQKLSEETELTRKQVDSVFTALTNFIHHEVGKKGPGLVTVPGLLKIKRVEKPATKESINDAYRKAAAHASYMGVLAVSEEQLVSIDFNGDSHSATVDASSTMMLGDLAKVLAWYDNETGYATRLFELAAYVAKRGL